MTAFSRAFKRLMSETTSGTVNVMVIGGFLVFCVAEEEPTAPKQGGVASRLLHEVIVRLTARSTMYFAQETQLLNGSPVYVSRPPRNVNPRLALPVGIG